MLHRREATGRGVDSAGRKWCDMWPVPWYSPCPIRGGINGAITASEARKQLFGLIERVNDDRIPREITSRRGDAVLLSRQDYEA